MVLLHHHALLPLLLSCLCYTSLQLLTVMCSLLCLCHHALLCWVRPLELLRAVFLAAAAAAVLIAQSGLPCCCPCYFLLYCLHCCAFFSLSRPPLLSGLLPSVPCRVDCVARSVVSCLATCMTVCLAACSWDVKQNVLPSLWERTMTIHGVDYPESPSKPAGYESPSK